MRTRQFRRLSPIIALGAAALVSSACFGGGGGQSAAQATATVAPVSTAAPPVASPPAKPSPPPVASPVASPTTVRASGPGQDYTVEAGDTLASVAQKFYNDPTLWRRIYDANKAVIGDNPDALKIGTQIRVPPKE